MTIRAPLIEACKVSKKPAGSAFPIFDLLAYVSLYIGVACAAWIVLSVFVLKQFWMWGRLPAPLVVMALDLAPLLLGAAWLAKRAIDASATNGYVLSKHAKLLAAMNVIAFIVFILAWR